MQNAQRLQNRRASLIALGLFLLPNALGAPADALAETPCSSGTATSAMSADEIENCVVDTPATKRAIGTSPAGQSSSSGISSTATGRAPGGQDTTATTGTGTSGPTPHAGGSSTRGESTGSYQSGVNSSVSGAAPSNTTGTVTTGATNAGATGGNSAGSERKPSASTATGK